MKKKKQKTAVITKDFREEPVEMVVMNWKSLRVGLLALSGIDLTRNIRFLNTVALSIEPIFSLWN